MKTDSRRKIKPSKTKTFKENKSHLIPKESEPNNFRDDFDQTFKKWEITICRFISKNRNIGKAIFIL